MPFKPEEQDRAYGFLSTQLTDFKLHADGRFAVDATEFGKLSGVRLDDIAETTGVLNIDQNGYFLSGKTDTNLGPVGGSDRQVAVWLPFEGFQSAYLRTSGLLRVASIFSIQGEAKLSPRGFGIDGKLSETKLDIAVNAQIGQGQNGWFVQGGMSVPPQFQTDFENAIQSAAAAAAQDAAQKYNAYEKATKDYEFELSLRGARTLIPPMCDAAVREIDSGIDTAFQKWPKVLGIEVPGKSQALISARNQAEPFKQRMRALKAVVLLPDGDAARAALKAALQNVLAHPRLVIKVTVLGAIYDGEVLSASQKDLLRKAITAVDALPDAGDRKIAAERIWKAASQQNALQAAADAIRRGASAVPRVTGIGFNQPLSASPFQVFVDIAAGTKTTRVTVPFDPAHPEALGTVVGVTFSSALSSQTPGAPPPSNGGDRPTILPRGVVNGAGFQATISPGSWVTIYGRNLAANSRTLQPGEIRNGSLPTQLDGVTVTIDGEPASIYFISPTQINVVAPADANSGLVPVVVTNEKGATAPALVDLEPIAPAFFESQRPGGRAFAIATHTNFHLAGDPAVIGDSQATPAKPGEAIILWGTGFGPTNPPTPAGTLASRAATLLTVPEITIGGIAADYVGGAVTPGFAGLYQIAVRVPDVADGNQLVAVSVSGESSPGNIYLSVRH
jgi:uncharacterized protein (TIGR03437 family)